jgi:hypothetical protein
MFPEYKAEGVELYRVNKNYLKSFKYLFNKNYTACRNEDTIGRRISKVPVYQAEEVM